MSDSDGVPLCPPEWDRAAEIDAAREAVIEAARRLLACPTITETDYFEALDDLVRRMRAYDAAKDGEA